MSMLIVAFIFLLFLGVYAEEKGKTLTSWIIGTILFFSVLLAIF